MTNLSLCATTNHVSTDRDSKGCFVKGHPAYNTQPGKNVGGAPKTLAGEVKDALAIAEDAMPQLYLDMIADAQNPLVSVRDRQMCREYLSDRIYGRPNQPLSGKLDISVWAELIKKALDIKE